MDFTISVPEVNVDDLYEAVKVLGPQLVPDKCPGDLELDLWSDQETAEVFRAMLLNFTKSIILQIKSAKAQEALQKQNEEILAAWED